MVRCWRGGRDRGSLPPATPVVEDRCAPHGRLKPQGSTRLAQPGLNPQALRRGASHECGLVTGCGVTGPGDEALRYLDTGTGKRISKIGLGTHQFGSSDWDYGEHYASREAGAIVRRALELGVTLFDSAEIYGLEAHRVVRRTVREEPDRHASGGRGRPRGHPGAGRAGLGDPPSGRGRDPGRVQRGATGEQRRRRHRARRGRISRAAHGGGAVPARARARVRHPAGPCPVSRRPAPGGP
jgi:hypothetical protein